MGSLVTNGPSCGGQEWRELVDSSLGVESRIQGGQGMNSAYIACCAICMALLTEPQ